MQDYTKLTDERLVALTQKGEDDAFSTLFLRYQHTLQLYAYKAHKRYPSFYEDEFFGFFQETFVKIVRRFDLTKGVYFPHYCKVIIPKFAYEYVRNKIQRRELVDGKKVNVEGLTERDKYYQFLTNREFTDYRLTYDYVINIEETELYQHLLSVDDEHARVVALLVDGYTYEEIARAFGRTGNYMALANWGKRAVQRVKTEVVKYYKDTDSYDELVHYV